MPSRTVPNQRRRRAKGRVAGLRIVAILALLAGALVGCCPPAAQAGVTAQATAFAAVVEDANGPLLGVRLTGGGKAQLDLGGVRERPEVGSRIYVEGSLEGSRVRVTKLTTLGSAGPLTTGR